MSVLYKWPVTYSFKIYHASCTQTVTYTVLINDTIVLRDTSIILWGTLFLLHTVQRSTSNRARRDWAGYCSCHFDALLSTEGHVSVNIHYQIRKKHIWFDLFGSLPGYIREKKVGVKKKKNLKGPAGSWLGDRDDTLFANEKGQVSKIGCVCEWAPLPNAVRNDQWAKTKWSQAKIAWLMKMECALTRSPPRPPASNPVTRPDSVLTGCRVTDKSDH